MGNDVQTPPRSGRNGHSQWTADGDPLSGPERRTQTSPAHSGGDGVSTGHDASWGGVCCRHLLEAINVIPWEADADTWQFTYVGPQAAAILGHPVRAWYAADFWTAHLHPEDRERATEVRRGSCRTGADSDSHYRMVRADGGAVWLRDLATVEGSDGRPRKLRGVLIDISESRQLIEQLEDRLGFETVLSDLSARLINLPADQVDREIEAGLRSMGEFLGIDRITLFQLAGDGAGLVVTHCWAIPGFEVPQGLIARDLVPWALAKILRKEVLVFSSPEELPGEAARDRETLRRFAQKSNVSIPLSAGGTEVFGALCFGTVMEERAWPEKLVQRLQLVAQVFANALVRKRTDQQLQQAVGEIKQLQDRLQQENVYLRQEVRLLHHHSNVTGQSKAIKRVLSQVEQVAAADTAVLLLGETGTGKELLAAAIHNLSPRRERTMVKVNCAALPATLVESELFGREKGAYTGALSRQVGRFELAHGSTIFLDEVGDLPPEVQVKLLRVLQEGTLEHLGSPRPIQVNVRLVAATHRDLAQAVREGRFREDLFYRLNVFPIAIPPLRERPEDIPLLVWAMVEELARKMGRTIRAIDKGSMEALQGYPWPGNVRELRNIIERAMITSTAPTLHIALPEIADSTAARSMALEDVERDHIRRALGLTRWRIRGKNGAADLLRLKPTTLESKMAKLGIRRPGNTSDRS